PVRVLRSRGAEPAPQEHQHDSVAPQPGAPPRHDPPDDVRRTDEPRPAGRSRGARALPRADASHRDPAVRTRLRSAVLRPDRHDIRSQLHGSPRLPRGRPRNRRSRHDRDHPGAEAGRMSEKRRGLGRGLGALIPTASAEERPVDVFFPGGGSTAASIATTTTPTDIDDSLELVPVPGAHFQEIVLDDIRPNSRQPRTVFDEDDLNELVGSIAEIGVLPPIVVRPDPTGEARFELIMGERRWRASREAGKETIPAIVRQTEDDDLLRDALLENLHRAALNPLEEAAA